MSEQEQLIINKPDVVIEEILHREERHEIFGTSVWPVARAGGNFFRYHHTADLNSAKKFISEQQLPGKFVLGVGVEMGEFITETGNGELKFTDFTGIWEQVEDVPDVYREALGGEL